MTMMGNIFARSKDDISTAMSYYEQALVVRPDDHIAMNNIGANLMLLGRVEDAGQYFEKAYAIDSSYPNTIYALGMIKDLKADHQAAFAFATQAMKKCAPSNPVYSNAFELAYSSAHKVAGMTDGMEMFNQYSQRLAVESGKNIEVMQDENVPTPAKLEMAENYKRDRHIIRFKKDRQAIIHLMMHELVHLDFAVRCRKINANYLFITTKEQKELFIRNNEPCISRLNREGYDDKAIAGFVTALFNGINSSIYNTPIDLFIEDSLYKSYPALRPFQFISLSSLLNEYIEAATNKKVAEHTPLPIRSANIILSLVHSLQFGDLFGCDMGHLFKASSQQLKIAKEFYTDYLKYQRADKALEAHILIMKWAKELRLDNYFSLVEENEYRSSRTGAVDIIEEPDHLIKTEPDQPQKSEVEFSGEPAGQAAVTMYCLSALQYFEDKNLEEIKKVGFEIAMLGQQGIDPANKEKKYRLQSIPVKEFTGLQLLAYMYAAFQVIDPFLDTGLKFKKEYEAAKELYGRGK